MTLLRIFVERCDLKIIDSDVLIIGGGNSALRTAIEACEFPQLKVLIASKSLIPGGASVMNGGHWNASGLGPKSGTLEDLFNDTIRAGHYLNDQRLVRIALEGAAEEVKNVERFGGMWPRQGRPDQYFIETHLLAQRSHHYQVHNPYSWEVAHSLRDETVRRGVRLYPELMITNLMKSDGMVVGATGIDIKGGNFVVLKSKSTVLATGGATRLYKFSSCERSATGDGYAMALRAGAELVNMEFMQWAPTQNIMPPERLSFRPMVYILGLKPDCIGKVKFLNSLGERFMKKYDPVWMEVTDRYQLSRALFNEIRQGNGTKRGGILIDFSEVPLEENNRWKKEELSPDELNRLGEVFTEEQLNWKKPIEVAPAALHTSGGVRVNANGETDVPGLYAVGDVAGGIRGAERLGGNCCAAEALVMGQRTGKAAAERALELTMPEVNWTCVDQEHERIFTPPRRDDGVSPFEFRAQLQDLMYHNVGVIRNGEGLKRALHRIEILRRESDRHLRVVDKHLRYNSEWITAIEVMNMLECAEVMTRAALFRTESRGGHYREDYPLMDNKSWVVETGIRLTKGQIQIYKKPLRFDYLKPGEVGYPEGEDLHTSWWLPLQFPKGIPRD